MLSQISTLTLRKQLGAVLDQVAEGEPVLVTRGEQPLVVLVAPERYEELTAGREDRLRRAADRVAEWRREYRVAATGADPVALVRADRGRVK